MSITTTICGFCCKVRGLTSCPLTSMGKTCKDLVNVKKDVLTEILSEVVDSKYEGKNVGKHIHKAITRIMK